MTADPVVRLIDIDQTNWRDVARVEPHPSQQRFVAPITYYLSLAHYGQEWHPLGVEVDGEIVGHVMWAIDETDRSVWLGGLVIDARVQGQGHGRATVRAFVDRFVEADRVDVALSYHPDNTAARMLYADMGFVETGEFDDDEVVARLRRG